MSQQNFKEELKRIELLSWINWHVPTDTLVSFKEAEESKVKFENERKRYLQRKKLLEAATMVNEG